MSELIERGFEHLEHTLPGNVVRLWFVTVLGPRSPVSVEDDRLLPHGDNPIDAVQEAAINQLVDQHPGLGVQRLLRGGLVLLVAQPVIPLVFTHAEVTDLVVNLAAHLENGTFVIRHL